MLRIAFHRPCIPANTGNAIRMVAATGFQLHLIGPLGFELSNAKLRRAGLDYHDLASVTVHADLAAAWTELLPARVFAFTGAAPTSFADVSYRVGDVLLADENVTARVRIPMLAGRRSLNLSNAAAVAAYEAWRQLGYRHGI